MAPASRPSRKPEERSSRRLGRPPAASGEETRARLVRSARRCFADYGYAGTSNRHIAEASGLTTGAMYHYFSSKQELYFAAHEGVQEQIYVRFEEVIAGCSTLLEELGAVFDVAVQLNREDPSLAAFLLSRSTDVERYPELAPVSAEPSQRTRFFGRMMERAVDRGEISPERAPMLFNIIRVVNAGLVFAASNDVELQAESVAAIKLLLAGELFSADDARPARR